jgi:DNA-binding MarR family transcriptional regulator
MLTDTEFKAVTGCNNNKISAYQLTTALLRGGLGKLNLNPTATITLMYLASCYNGRAVYPRIETIAQNTGLSSSGVKKAIAELVQKGCILKSKKHNGTNANIYTLTNKVFDSVNVSTQKEPKRDTTGTNKSTCCGLSCNKKSDNKKLDKKIRETKISDKDLEILNDYVSKNPNIVNKAGYLKKLLSSDTTLLLKRLRAEKQAIINAETAVRETKELLENYKKYKAESSAPTAFYQEWKTKTLAKIARNQV